MRILAGADQPAAQSGTRRPGAAEDRRARNGGRPFETVYTAADVRLLAVVDEAFGMSALATCEILRREFEVHGDAASSGWRACRARASTQPAPHARLPDAADDVGEDAAESGIRGGAQGAGAERPAGLPARRHRASGRQDGRKGRLRRQRRGRSHPVRARRRPAGHLRAVHGSAARSAAGHVPVPRARLPSRQRVAQRRAGSEYVNHRVAALLDKLHVGEFTKSRSRRSNDNALVEGKNARVVRRHLGHEHIPVRFAGDVDRFCREDLSPLLNFHRPCLFAAERADAKGKVRRIHPRQGVATPLAKLKSLPDAARFLKDGTTFDALDRAATAQTGLQAAEALGRARDELFRKVHGAPAAA